MKIVITGSDGFVGKHLTAKLSEHNEILTIDLNSVDCPVNILSQEFLQLGVRFNPDVIVHLAGVQFTKPVPRWRRKLFFNQNKLMAEAVSELMVSLTDLKQVLFVSTDMVYGIPVGGKISPDFRPSPIGPYGQSKFDSELILREASTRVGVPLAIFRPRLINGRGRSGTIGTLARIIGSNLPVPIIGKGENRYQMIAVGDVVQAIEKAIGKKADGIYNLGSAASPTVNELLSRTVSQVGSRSLLIRLPSRPMVALLTCLDYLGVSPLSEEQFKIANLNYELDVSKTERDLEWASTQSDYEIMEEALMAFYETNND